MSVTTLAEAHDALLVDLDGTLIRGTEPIPGAADALEVIKAVELGGQNDGVDVLALGI